MNNSILRFVFIPLFIFIIYWLTSAIRNKLAKPQYKEEVQTPGLVDNFLLKLLTVIAVFSALLTVLGFFIQETEMAIAFLVLTVIFTVIVLFLKRQYDISYQENSKYFILKAQQKEYKVFYENIVDWQPSFNEIKILDKTKSDNKYIRVNIAMLKPEILLRKIAEMTFTGKFYSLDDEYLEDPTREYQITNFLIENNYGYLIEDYVEQ